MTSGSMRLAAFLLIAGTASPAALAQSTTGAEAYTWDLPAEYPTQQAWDADRDRLRSKIEALAGLKGKAAGGPTSLADVLDDLHATRGLAARMARFAYLTSGVDTGSEAARARLAAAVQLEREVEVAAAPLEAEIRAIGKAKVSQWAAAEPRLRQFAIDRRLQRIFFAAAHSPPPDAEAIVGSMAAWADGFGYLYDEIVDTAVNWPTLTDSRGNSLAMSPGNYRALRRDPDSAIRSSAARAFHQATKPYEELFGALFDRRVEADLAVAHAHGFDDSVVAALTMSDGFPESAIRQPSAVAHAHPEIPVRYASLLARAYRVPSATYSEALGRSPWAFNGTIPVKDAIDLIVSSWTPFGPDYQAYLRKIYARHWIDLPPRPNKEGAFGVHIQAGGGNPYGSMSYTGDLASVRSLASIGQALQMDADIPPGGEPDRRDEDQPTFGNARWGLAQYLVDSALVDKASSPEQRVAILFDQLNRMWTDLFYRAALIDLDHWVMEQVARGEPPSGSEISAKYLALVRAYSGEGAGGLSFDDSYAREWIAESQLFLSHYQNRFAASAAAAAAMIEGVERRDPRILGTIRNIRGRHLEYSNDFLLSLGIDMSTPAPYEALVHRMQVTMDRIDRELKAMGR